jgi:hypothetical protein
MEALEPLVGGGIVALNAGDYSPDPDANPRVFPFSSIFISNLKISANWSQKYKDTFSKSVSFGPLIYAMTRSKIYD